MVRLLSPHVSWSPNTGQQTGRPAYGVVGWAGHLLVPCLRWTASDQHWDDYNGEREFRRPLHDEHWRLNVRTSTLEQQVLLEVTAHCLYPRFPSLLIATRDYAASFRHGKLRDHWYTIGSIALLDGVCLMRVFPGWRKFSVYFCRF